jgi:hypothetical protein
MKEQKRVRVLTFFGLLVLLAGAYILLIYSLPILTGTNKIDGSIGVVLGLYICSHPAANLLDMLLFDRGAHTLGTSRRALFTWIGLNTVMVMLAWIVITVGTTRFTRP